MGSRPGSRAHGLGPGPGAMASNRQKRRHDRTSGGAGSCHGPEQSAAANKPRGLWPGASGHKAVLSPGVRPWRPDFQVQRRGSPGPHPEHRACIAVTGPHAGMVGLGKVVRGAGRTATVVFEATELHEQPSARAIYGFPGLRHMAAESSKGKKKDREKKDKSEKKARKDDEKAAKKQRMSEHITTPVKEEHPKKDMQASSSSSQMPPGSLSTQPVPGTTPMTGSPTAEPLAAASQMEATSSLQIQSLPTPSAGAVPQAPQSPQATQSLPTELAPDSGLAPPPALAAPTAAVGGTAVDAVPAATAAPHGPPCAKAAGGDVLPAAEPAAPGPAAATPADAQPAIGPAAPPPIALAAPAAAPATPPDLNATKKWVRGMKAKATAAKAVASPPSVLVAQAGSPSLLEHPEGLGQTQLEEPGTNVHNSNN